MAYFVDIQTTAQVNIMTNQTANQTTNQTTDINSILERIDSVADHGQALALSLVANDHFNDIAPGFVACMLDDLEDKFKVIKAEVKKLHHAYK